jgi:hypothetical protein
MKLSKRAISNVYSNILNCFVFFDDERPLDIIYTLSSFHSYAWDLFVVRNINTKSLLPSTIDFLINHSVCPYCLTPPSIEAYSKPCKCHNLEFAFYYLKNSNFLSLKSLTDLENKRSKRRIRARSQSIVKGFTSDGAFNIIWDLQDGKCIYCQKILGLKYDRSLFHVDHYSPLSLGGENKLINFRLACSVCNLSKSNVTFSVFWKRTRRRLLLPYFTVLLFSKWVTKKNFKNRNIIDFINELDIFVRDTFYSRIKADKGWLLEFVNNNQLSSLITYKELIIKFKKSSDYVSPAQADKWIENKKNLLRSNNNRIKKSLKSLR